MKRTLVAIVLASALVPGAQAAVAQQPSGQTGGSQSQGPVIKDPAEYNAYMAAIQQQEPTAKISGLEAFLTQYPSSVVKVDALELLMATYQGTGNQAKTIEAAQRLLQFKPDNVRALALLAYLMRTRAQGGDPNAAQLLVQAKEYGTKGLQALPNFPKPEGTSDADFEKLKVQMSGIFNAAIGIAALQDKDYPTATKDLRAAADGNPKDFSIVYPLALAYLQAAPPDFINGVWYAARASVVAPTPQYQQQIEKYARSQYVKYHGGDDGWADVLAQAKTSETEPAGFTIKPAPTPAEQAEAIVKDKTPDQIKQLSFAEWELVLSKGTPEVADKVWSVIKGLTLQMEGNVIKGSDTELQLAASSDDIDQKRADIVLTMTGPIPARMLPKEGATLDFGGTPESYTADPFVMNMDKGTLLKAAGTPTRKTPTRRRSTSRQ
jgi:tetratricopeptide (TPR) repeat protein